MQTYYIATPEGPVLPGTVLCAIPLASSPSSGFYITHISEDPFPERPQQSPASIHVLPYIILYLPYLPLSGYTLDEHGPSRYTTEPHNVPDMSSFQAFTGATVPITNSTQMSTPQAEAFTNWPQAESYLSQSSNINISPSGYYPTFQPVDQALEVQTLNLDPLPSHSVQDNFVLPEQLSTSLALDPNLLMDNFPQGSFLAPPILTGSSPVPRQTQSCVDTSASC